MKNSQIKKLANMELNEDENYAIISLNPAIFPVDAVKSAINSAMYKALAVIAKDSSSEIIVELRPKGNGKGLEELGREFNNWLITNAFDKLEAEKNKMEKIETCHEDKMSIIEENLAELEKQAINDPLGISKLWKEA
ncbi:hypothetical protein HYU09_02740 [Candidatus Woesearchaeota archaeon]|nr:hypothetical protein [Candidatus Woesearchaeota archaeon]